MYHFYIFRYARLRARNILRVRKKKHTRKFRRDMTEEQSRLAEIDRRSHKTSSESARRSVVDT